MQIVLVVLFVEASHPRLSEKFSILSFLSIILTPSLFYHQPLHTTSIMATTAEPVPHAENISFQTNHQEIAFPLPRALHTTVHIHLTFQPTHTMVFLATTMPGDSGEKPLGSFVYAMPDVRILFPSLFPCRPSQETRLFLGRNPRPLRSLPAFLQEYRC